MEKYISQLTVKGRVLQIASFNNSKRKSNLQKRTLTLSFVCLVELYIPCTNLGIKVW